MTEHRKSVWGKWLVFLGDFAQLPCHTGTTATGATEREHGDGGGRTSVTKRNEPRRLAGFVGGHQAIPT